MSGSKEDLAAMFDGTDNTCPHNVIRKKRSADPHQYTFNAYVCGSCAKIFEVSEHIEQKPTEEPMFPKHRVPWGLRDRQA